jgi:hypothetical protein
MAGTAYRIPLILCIGVVVLGGCARGVTSTPGEAPNLEKWVAEVRAKPAPPLEPLPVMQQFETFEYAAQGLRDPFSRAFTDEGGSGLRPDAARRKQPLEAFPLDSLDMVGTLGRGPASLRSSWRRTRSPTACVPASTWASRTDASPRSPRIASNSWSWCPMGRAAGWNAPRLWHSTNNKLRGIAT